MCANKYIYYYFLAFSYKIIKKYMAKFLSKVNKYF